MAGYVLIVESDPELQRQVGVALREAGFDLAAETEAAWAQRSVRKRPPDLIVVDTRLSDGDGFRLADQLRREPATRSTPILFIASSHRGASHRAEARRRFAPADYLATPLDVTALVPRVTALVGAIVSTPTARPPESGDLDGAPPSGPLGLNVGAGAAKGPLRDPAQQRERRDVERSAKHLTADPGQSGFHGTLKRTPFARLIQRLYTERGSGTLLLLHEPTKKIVTFADGYPISVRSNVPGETLGQILLERRLISADALEESGRRMHAEKRQQGQILIEMGVLSPYNLERALVEQADAKLFEIFSWPDGKFMFRAGDTSPAPAVRLERSPAALILEGIRRHYNAARLDAVLAPYAGQAVTLTSDPVLRLQEMTEEAGEMAFIRGLETPRRIADILAGAEISADKARLLLVALSEAGMLQRAEASSRRRPAPAPPPLPRVAGATANPTATPPTPPTGAVSPPPEAAARPPAASAAASAGTPPPIPALSGGQLAMMLQTVRTQDHFWVLGVGQDASITEIDQAYESLARTFHADRYRLAPEEDRKVAQEVFERLTDAHRTLHDPGRRRAYVTKLARAEASADDDATASPPAAAERAARAVASAAAVPSSTTARALYEAGLEHLRARRHHEAVEALRQSARLVPNEADYRAALGWALFRQAPADARAGRAAVAELRRALQINERHREAAQHLAEIYAQTGQPELAVQELERLLAIDPAALEVADELRRLRTR